MPPESVPRVRLAPVPEEGVLVVRGDELDPGLLVEDAERCRARFTDWDRYGISAFHAASDDEVDALCQARLVRFDTVVVFSRANLEIGQGGLAFGPTAEPEQVGHDLEAGLGPLVAVQLPRPEDLLSEGQTGRGVLRGPVGAQIRPEGCGQGGAGPAGLRHGQRLARQLVTIEVPGGGEGQLAQHPYPQHDLPVGQGSQGLAQLATAFVDPEPARALRGRVGHPAEGGAGQERAVAGATSGLEGADPGGLARLTGPALGFRQGHEQLGALALIDRELQRSLQRGRHVLLGVLGDSLLARRQRVAHGRLYFAQSCGPGEVPGQLGGGSVAGFEGAPDLEMAARPSSGAQTVDQDLPYEVVPEAETQRAGRHGKDETQALGDIEGFDDVGARPQAGPKDGNVEGGPIMDATVSRADLPAPPRVAISRS